MNLTDQHLAFALIYVANHAPCRLSRSLFSPDASIRIALGVASIISPDRNLNPILHLGEPCPAFRSVPLILSIPGPHEWTHCAMRAIPFAALGLSHEAAA